MNTDNLSSLQNDADKDEEIKALREALELKEAQLKIESVAFYEWASNLSPVNKISVHGIGGGFGPVNLTSEELYDNFKRWQKKQADTPAIGLSEWTSVEKEMPPSNEDVLCVHVGGRLYQQSWCAYTDQDEAWFKRTFTHWRPLPAKP